MANGILIQSLDRYIQQHKEWFGDTIFPDLPSAVPDIQRRIGLGSDLILVRVGNVNGLKEIMNPNIGFNELAKILSMLKGIE